LSQKQRKEGSRERERERERDRDRDRDRDRPRDRQTDRQTEGKIHLYHETYEMDISTNKVAPNLLLVSIVFIQIVQKEILGVSLERKSLSQGRITFSCKGTSD
jgi:Ni/Co efflux regulator RcnB